MVRAATSGMIDFGTFDPRDKWCWKRLNWVLAELETQQTLRIAEIEHRHWVTLAASNRLTNESFDNVKTHATAAMNRVLKATYPWNADKIGEAGLQTEREDAVKTYQAVFGKPGDPRYEALIDTLLRESKQPPMTARQRAQHRERRRKQREEALKNRG